VSASWRQRRSRRCCGPSPMTRSAGSSGSCTSRPR
jgi:hypothetical protein